AGIVEGPASRQDCPQDEQCQETSTPANHVCGSHDDLHGWRWTAGKLLPTAHPTRRGEDTARRGRCRASRFQSATRCGIRGPYSHLVAAYVNIEIVSALRRPGPDARVLYFPSLPHAL